MAGEGRVRALAAMASRAGLFVRKIFVWCNGETLTNLCFRPVVLVNSWEQLGRTVAQHDGWMNAGEYLACVTPRSGTDASSCEKSCERSSRISRIRLRTSQTLTSKGSPRRSGQRRWAFNSTKRLTEASRSVTVASLPAGSTTQDTHTDQWAQTLPTDAQAEQEC